MNFVFSQKKPEKVFLQELKKMIAIIIIQYFFIEAFYN